MKMHVWFYLFKLELSHKYEEKTIQDLFTKNSEFFFVRLHTKKCLLNNHVCFCDGEQLLIQH